MFFSGCVTCGDKGLLSFSVATFHWSLSLLLKLKVKAMASNLLASISAVAT